MAAWTELTIEVLREHAEAIASFLFDHGSSGMQEEETATAVLLKAYFEGHVPLAELEGYARDVGAAAALPSLSTRIVDEEDWANSWRDHFVPLSIGRRLFVCPPWTQVRPQDRSTIVIDPGMAFGTGHHATTRMCLVLCEEMLDRQRVDRAVDLGAGSGILAIALAKLGVGRVWAVEIDPVALDATVVNARDNEVAAAIVPLATFDAVPRAVDLLVANLFTNLLVELAPKITQAVKSGGVVVCSGFIDGDAARVEDALVAAGLRVCARRHEEGWAALALERA